MENETKFRIGSKVKVSAHDITGVVNAIYIGRNGVQIEVEYKDSIGKLQSRYFTESELESA